MPTSERKKNKRSANDALGHQRNQGQYQCEKQNIASFATASALRQRRKRTEDAESDKVSGPSMGFLSLRSPLALVDKNKAPSSSSSSSSSTERQTKNNMQDNDTSLRRICGTGNDSRGDNNASKSKVDEYGEIELSEEDFAAIDSLAVDRMKESKRNFAVSSPMEKHDEDEFGSLEIDFNVLDKVVAQRLAGQCLAHTSELSMTSIVRSSQLDNSKEAYNQQSLSNDDEFGSFPDDIDFNALDEVIARRIVSQPISDDGTVHNVKLNDLNNGHLSFTNFSRYKVITVDDDIKNNNKTISVAVWNNSMIQSNNTKDRIRTDNKIIIDGIINLRGEWYHTPVESGNVVHICSLTGLYRTDVTALPITLHTFPPPGSDIDDLILVLHPDMLLTPSTISETSYCNRRAVLKSKIGSDGSFSRAAFVGTMRHALFEACMNRRQFDEIFAQEVTKDLIREKSESLIGCNISESEIEGEVLNVLPMIQKFAGEYTTLKKDAVMPNSVGKEVGGVALHPDIRFLAKGVHSVEENIVSTELGLKGAVDAILETETMIIGRKQNANNYLGNSAVGDTDASIMCLELKTGHNQNAQHGHMAQLSLYICMLQSRYGSKIQFDFGHANKPQSGINYCGNGASPGGVLLYLNHQSQQISYVSPQLGEIKTLMGQRNVVASGLKKACSPRGVTLSYAEGTRGDNNMDAPAIATFSPATAADLPQLINPHSCKRCFSNRECMLYVASGSDLALDVVEGHKTLLSKFTGHLKEEDLAYFRKWDKLIDIEVGGSNSKTSDAWLVNSRLLEINNGETISGLTVDMLASYKVEDRALICFRREHGANSLQSLDSLRFSPGAYVIVSTDGTIFDDFTNSKNITINKSRHRMHVTKGFIDRIESNSLFLSTNYDELKQIELMIHRCRGNQSGSKIALSFRIDKSKTVSTSTLRWNLINFLNGDYRPSTTKECTPHERIKQQRLPRLRDLVIRLKAPEFASDLRCSIFNGIDQQGSEYNLRVLLEDEFSHQLNNDQQDAVRMAVSGKDYTLIQGLPGTGKTSTLTFLARLFMAKGKKVLITAYTHSAVDNIMLKLIEKGMGSTNAQSGTSELVRLGNKNSCHESVKTILHSELARKVDTMSENLGKTGDYPQHPSAISIKRVITDARIVGVTALSLPRSPLLQNEIFDVVIIDEAGQINEPATLGAISAADTFILVGDHKQLPPLVNNMIAEKSGYGTSVLKRLADEHPHAIAQLTIQYRMNEDICRICSEAMYEGRMKCGNEKVGSQLLKLPYYPALVPKPINDERCVSWLRSVVDPERPVIFVDTDNICIHTDNSSLEGKVGGKAGGSIVNRTEATLARYILSALHLCGHDLSDIGVISPFRAQIGTILESPTIQSWKKIGLELSTIDKYQGRDKSTIVLSLVRSNDRKIVGRLLQDERRLNVALTRAKKKLIVIGSFRTLKNGSNTLNPILERMDERNQRIQLPRNAIECYNIP